MHELTWRRLIIFAAAVILLCAFGTALLWLPEKMVSSVHTRHPHDFKDYAEVVDKYRSTLAQAIGGAVLLIGIYFTARSVAAAEQTRWTKTFSDAITQLGQVSEAGTPIIAVRLGAIYALERLSRDSPKDAYVICKILAQYIHIESKGRQGGNVDHSPPPCSDVTSARTTPSVSQIAEPRLGDVEAALIVLGIITGGKPLRKDERLRLDDCFLPNLTLSGRKFANFQFHRSIVSASRMDSSDCSSAEFQNCELNSCTFANCQLEGAEFNNVNGNGIIFSSALCRRSRFLSCTLPECDFSNAMLDRSDFSGSNLTGSAFAGASMVGAVMSEADLDGVSFDGADLLDADLRTARNLTTEQLESAKRAPQVQHLPAYLQVSLPTRPQ